VDRSAAVGLTAVAGGLIALQAPVNSTLGRAVGTLQAAFVSFAIGTAALLVLAALAHGAWGRSRMAATSPGTPSPVASSAPRT
jgi:transporter family-2 protein